MKVIQFWKPALWLFVILVLSLIPGDNLPSGISIPHLDKIVHFGMYFGLTVLLVKPLRQITTTQSYLVAIVLSLLIGGLVEIIQMTMAVHRSGSWFDFWADTAGAFFGAVFYRFFIERKKWEFLF